MLGCAHRGCLHSASCPGLFAASELTLVSVLSTSLSSVVAWDHHPVAGFLTEPKWEFFNWKYSYLIPAWKDHPFLTLHFSCEITPCFLASPALKTLGYFWKFSQLDVRPLLIHVNASQLTHVTWPKSLGVLSVSAIPSSVTQGHQRGWTGSYQWSL